MKIKEFYDPETFAFSYILIDEETKNVAIIDSVLNYNYFSGKIKTLFVQEIIDYVTQNNLQVQWILETHIHADHLTAAHFLKQKYPQAKIAIGDGYFQVKEYWSKFFEQEFSSENFDVFFKDGEKFNIGNLEVEVIKTTGHTESCICYKVQDAVFVGDVIFMPDVGTARTDFPGGSSEKSFESIQKIYNLGDDVKIYSAHDYPPQNREIQFSSTVKMQKENNIMVKNSVSKKEFVKNRDEKDKNKEIPRLLYPSLQINLCAGNLKDFAKNGKFFLKLPLDLKELN